MRSTAHVKAHPLHPALIPFPFAFLTGALLFDLAAALLDAPVFATTASHLTAAGIVSGLVAAVPGAIDYWYAVPPDSSAQTRARTHGLLNVGALLLFGVAWLLRPEGQGAGLVVLGLELVGAALLAYSGSLGGTLVTRNMISVDHRYADAGKWQDVTVRGPAGEPIDVGAVGDLVADQMKLLRVGDRRIALARTTDGYVAFDDRCSHRGGSLAGSVMIGGVVQCLWHGSQFDGRTGKALCGPAKRGIGTYTVRESNGRILLEL